MADNYDYTDLGADHDPNDLVIGTVSAAGFDADQIEKENGFRDIPPGEHVLIVQDVKVQDEKFFKVLVGGRLAGYTSRSVIIRFHLPNDKRASISDFFTLPPSNSAEMEAYANGVPSDKPDGSAGFPYKKFFHFMERLGFLDANKTLTPAGGRTSNWKGRAIIATVEAGRGTYFNKKENRDVPRTAGLKMFSYKRADQAAMQAATAGQGQGQTTAAHPAQVGRPAMAPAPAPASFGGSSVDDVLANI